VSLDQRLRQLRGQSAARRPPASARSGLAERLRRLGSPAHRPVGSKAPDEQTLAASVGAESFAPGVLLVQRRIALDQRQGHIRIRDCLSALPDLLDKPACDARAWMFLDTETSGLAGGTGTWVFLCGLLRVDAQGLALRQYLLTRLDAEGPYLEAIASELETAGLLVTYNGKSFDIPLLVTRFRLAGLSITFEGKLHLDVLHPIRRVFGPLWPDCRLVTAEQRLLGLARARDLPGAEIPAAWLAWLRQGEVEALAAVLRHNRWDLLSLPALAVPLRRSLIDPVASGADVHAVARLHLSLGNADPALALLSAHRERLGPPALLDLARLHRRRGEWAAASAIWKTLAEQGVPEALEAQAKYLEHQKRQYVEALECVARLPDGSARDHRRQRLEEKLKACLSRSLP
jgi:uncharacterized protein YprB with RNaseH-like and TPR domain